MTAPKSIKPLYAHPEEFGPTAMDEYGVVWSTSEIDRGAPIGPSLSEANLSEYTFPNPAAEYRFSGLKEWCHRK